MWALANDDPEKLRAYADQQGFDFPFLLDPEATTIRAWGIFNDRDHRGRLIPHPTVVIVDREGVVRYVDTETDYRVRPPVSELLRELGRLSD